MKFEISEAHVADIAWLIGLYIAIHGGDPPPSEVFVDMETVEIAAALVDHLSATFSQQEEGAFTYQGLQKHFKARGLSLAITTPVGGSICVTTQDGTAVCLGFPRRHAAE